MNSHARSIHTPGASRKRKERESVPCSTSLKPLVKQTAVNVTTTSCKGAEPKDKLRQQPMSSNRLLAGYLAHEFLTKGTLFGKKFEPARADTKTVNARKEQIQKQSQVSTEAEPIEKFKPHSYTEVANLLKSDGAHIPGVVNPTQLARWIQM